MPHCLKSHVTAQTSVSHGMTHLNIPTGNKVSVYFGNCKTLAGGSTGLLLPCARRRSSVGSLDLAKNVCTFPCFFGLTSRLTPLNIESGGFMCFLTMKCLAPLNTVTIQPSVVVKTVNKTE